MSAIAFHPLPHVKLKEMYKIMLGQYEGKTSLAKNVCAKCSVGRLPSPVLALLKPMLSSLPVMLSFRLHFAIQQNMEVI